MDSEELLKQDVETRKWLDDIESFRSPPPLRNIFAESIERSDPRTVNGAVTSDFVFPSTSGQDEFDQKVRKFQLSSAHPYANRGRIETSKSLSSNFQGSGLMELIKEEGREKIRISKEQASALKEAVKRETRPVNMCSPTLAADVRIETFGDTSSLRTLDTTSRSIAYHVDAPQPFHSSKVVSGASSSSAALVEAPSRHTPAKEVVADKVSVRNTLNNGQSSAEERRTAAGRQTLVKSVDVLSDVRSGSPTRGYQTLIADKEVSDIFSKSTDNNGRLQFGAKQLQTASERRGTSSQPSLPREGSTNDKLRGARPKPDAVSVSSVKTTASSAVNDERLVAKTELPGNGVAAMPKPFQYSKRQTVQAEPVSRPTYATADTQNSVSAMTVSAVSGSVTEPTRGSVSETQRISRVNGRSTVSIADRSANGALERQQAQFEKLEREVENELEAKNVMYGYCSACGKEVTSSSEATHALGRLYHAECFTCSSCGRTLKDKKFYEVRGRIYCEEDYLYSGFQQSAEKCAACGHLIMDMILQAAGKSFHPQCFRCNTCKKCLDGVPFTVDNHGRFYCVQDYHLQFAPKCAKCKQCITPSGDTEETVRVVAMQNDYHVDCYVCEACGAQLTDEPEKRCYPLDNHLLCRTCNLHWTRTGGANSLITDV